MVLRCTLLLALAAGAFAVPVSRSGSTCAVSTCPEPAASKFRLQTGSTYEYDYTADIKTSMVGASEEHSSLHMTALVRIEILSTCELALVMRSVALQDSNPRDLDNRDNVDQMANFRSALQANPLRFAWIDGVIEHICPDEEPTWVVNVKRGILSGLQNSMEDLTTDHNIEEIDISGKCPVSYSRTRNGFSTDTITKVKDMLACTSGHNYETVFHGIPYGAQSRIQSLPLMDSVHECDQEITSEGIINKVTCTEKHLFRPFSNQENGATTEVMTSLIYKGVERRTTTRLGPVSLHEYLVYDSTPSAEEMAENFRDALSTLQTICSTMTEDVRPEVPGHFVRLVHDMRKLDMSNLVLLHRRAGNVCDKAVEFYRDAVPNLGTTASLTLIRDLIQRNEVSEMEAEIWLTSLSFIPRPSLDLLSEAASLLSLTGVIGRKANLAVSSLVNNYCHLHADCANEREIQNIIRIFEDNLNYNCRGEHDVVLMSLKALGNAGVASNAVATLNRCFSSEEIVTELRVEAIKAFRRLPCTADRSELMTLYTDISKDSELRINAFLQIMQCPTTEVIRRVRRQLENEEVNQVGSFVWTYLTNLIESSDPHKKEIGDILMDERLAKEFNLDKRKFSRNIEWSLFSHMLNTGGTVESNIIWSEKSFVPRSAMVNLTVDMFGHAMNLLEIGGRVEGVDALLERIFGPKQTGNDIRSKRAVIDQEDINVLDGRFDASRPTEPKGNMYIKMFGNEIRYDDFHGIDMDSLKDKFNYLEWLIKLSEDHNFEITKNNMFLDASYVVPTGVGMPLKLTAEGSSTINLKMNGRMDLRSLASNPMRVDILGSIEPSAAVEITSNMGVDAHIAKTGLKMVSTLHTSTVASGKLEIEGGRIVSFDFNMPREKLEILEAKSNFYITHRGQDREQRMLTDTVYTRKECLDLAKSMGIELCAEASVPIATSSNGPLTPFTGPVSVELYGMKRDSFQKYHFEMSFEQERQRGALKRSVASLVMDTPGSRVNREVAWTASVDHLNWNAEMTLRSPWKQVNFNADLQNTDTLKALSLVAMVDESTEYSLNINMPIEETDRGYEFTPQIILTWPNIPQPRITGTMLYIPGRKVDFNVRMRNVFSEPAKALGSVTLINNARRFKVDLSLTVQSPILNSVIEGFIDRQADITSSRVSVQYTADDGQEQTVTLNGKLRDQSTQTLMQYVLDSQWTSTLLPEYNGDFKVEAGYGRNTMTFNLDTGFDETRRLTLKETGSLMLAGVTKSASGEFLLTMPWKNINYDVKFSNTMNKDELTMNYEVDVGAGREGLFEVNLRRISMNPLKISSNMKLHYPGREFEVVEELEETAPRQYSHNARVQLQPDYVITSDSVLKMKPTIELTSTLNVPGKRPISLEANINPVLSDLRITGNMNVEGDIYSTEATLQYGGNSRRHNSEATFDLVYPGRHITHNSQYSYNDGVINGNSVTKWDADNDPSKQTSTVYRMTLSATSPALYGKTEWYPNRFVEVDSSATFGDTLEGQLTFKNNLQVEIAREWNFGFNIQPQQFGATVHLEGSADNKRSTIDLNYMLNRRWDKHEVTLDITTPWDTWRTIKLETSHDLTPRSLNMIGSFGWDDNEVRLVSENTINWRRKSYNGGVTFTSPWEGLENIRLNGRHQMEEPVHTTTIEVSWGGRGNSLSYNQVLTLQPGTKFAIESTLTTPFRGLESLRLDSSIEKSGNTYSTNNELEWAPGRMITLVSTLTLDGYAFDGTFRFTTPFESLERFVMNANNAKRGSLWVSHLDLEYAPTKSIELDTQIDTETYKKFLVVLKCEACPYIGTTSIDAEINGNMVTHTGKIELSSTKLLREPILITTEVDVSNIHDMSATLNYRSPVGLRTMQIEFTHQRRARVYNSALTFTIPSYTVSLTNELRMVSLEDLSATTVLDLHGDQYRFVTAIKGQPRLEVSVMLHTPSETWPQVGFELTHEGTHTDFTTTFDITYGRNYKMTSRLGYTSNRNSLNINGEINGLLNKDFKLTLSHNGDFYSNMDTTMEFTYGQTKQVASDVGLFNGRNTESSVLSRLLPLLNKEIEIKFTHAGSIRDFTSTLETGVNGRKVVTTLTYSMRGARFGGSLRITTPWESARSIFLGLNHNGPLNDFENDITWELNDDRYRMENSFTYSRNGLDVASTITTPIEGYETITANFVHSGTIENFSTSGDMDFGGRRATFGATFEMASTIKATLELQTPFRRLRRLTANLEHTSENWSDFNSDVDVTLNGQQYRANVLFKWVTSSLTLDASATTPDNNYGVTVRHRGGPTDFENTITIQSPDGEIKSELSFKNDANGIEAGLEITTPFENYNSFTGTLRHQGSLSDFESSLTINTPWRKLSTLALSMNHEGTLSEFTNGASITLNRKTISGTSTWVENSRRIQASLGLTTPFQGYDNFAVNIEHRWQDAGFTTTASVETPFTNFASQSAEVVYSGPWNELEASVTLTSSIPGYNRFMASVTNKMVGGDLEMSAKVETPIEGYNSFELTVTHSGPLTNFVSRAIVVTSIRGSRRLSAEVRHNQENGIQTSFNIRTPWEAMNQMGGELTLTNRDDGFDLTASLTTPFEKLEHQQLTVTHTGRSDLSQFTTDATLQWGTDNKNVNGHLEYAKRRQQITAGLRLTSTLEDLDTILNAELTHKMLNEGFESDLSCNTHWTPPVQVAVTYSGQRTDFEATANLQWGSKRIETECTFRMDSTSKSLDWKLKRSPWDLVRNLEVSASRSIVRNAKSGTLKIVHNSEEKLDLDVSYTKSMPYNVHVTVRQPIPMEGIVNYNEESPKTTGDISLTYRDQTLTADMEVTCRSDYYTTDKKVVLNAMMPSGRPMSLDVELYKTDSEFRHTGTMSWQRGRQGTWNVQLSKSSRRGQETYTGTVSVESPMVTQEATLTHVVTNDRQWTTTLTVPRGITLTHDLTMDHPSYSHIVEITHPRLRKGIKSEISGTWDFARCKIEGDVKQYIENEEFVMHGRIEDESGTGERIVMEWTANNPAINLDIDFSSVYINNRNQWSYNMDYKHMTAYDRQVKTFELRSSFDKTSKDLSIDLVNPLTSINFVGRFITDQPNHRVYEVTRTWEGRTIKLEVGREDNTIYAQITRSTGPYEHDHVVRAVGTFTDMRNMNIEIYHNTDGQQTQDVNLGIRENRRNVITARTFIRNNIALDLGNYAAGLDWSPAVQAVTAFYEGILEDRRIRLEQVKRRSGNNLNEALQTIAGEQIEYITNSYNRMYRDNEFYVKTVVDFISVGIQLGQRNMNRLSESASRTVMYYQNRASRIWNQFINKLNEKVNAWNAEFLRLIDEYWPDIQEFHVHLERFVLWMDEMVTAVRNHPWVQWYYATLERIKTGEFMAGVRAMKADMEEAMRVWEERYQLHLDILRDIWRNINRRPEVREVKAVLDKIWGYYEWMNENYDIEDTMVKIATKLSEITWDVVKDRIYYAIKSQINKSAINVWDPDNVHLEADLYIPKDFLFDLHSGLPDFYIRDRIRKLLIWIENMIPESDWTFWDYYYYYTPSMCPGDWIPPFKSWATLAGTQHYMTFDKKFYEFAGDCSYLLARDFIDENFAVVVNYNSRSGSIQKSITVTDGRNQVEILPTGEVQKDGASAELPLVMDATTILREGNMITVKNDHGIDIMCDLIYDRCTVAVNGWYYGKTAGLLGTYDNEPVTDLITSDGTITDDIDVFTRSWVVGRCRSRNIAVIQEPIEGTRPYELCAAHFVEDSSPFRPCFKIVDPAPFLKMCSNDFASNENAVETVQGVCKSGAFYVQECSKQRVTIRLPTDCVKCKTESSEFMDEITLEGSDVPQSADVIFVIQHAECNTAVVENLREIIDDLESVMTSADLRNNRYGVVGYGATNKLNEPHSHTMDGQLLNTHEKFVQGIESWMNMEMGHGVVDPLRAIHFAAQYPFRTGVSKTIVVIPCEDCDEVDVSYSDAAKILKNRDIRLHVLMDHAYVFKRGIEKPQTPFLYGADRNGLFTKKHLRDEIASDRELYNQVKLPGDLCSSLSHGSLGTVFDVNQFTQSRKAEQKRFVQVMVRVIAEVAQPPECQYCQCVADSTGAGVSICRSCSSNAFDLYGLYPDIFKFNEGGIFDFSFSDIV